MQALLYIALFALLGSSLVFAIIELGLSGYVVSAWAGAQSYYDLYSGYVQYSPTPAILGFVVFASLWTIIVAVAALVVPWFFSRKGAVTSKLNAILGITFAVAYFTTMVFWLASFADIASWFGGYTSTVDVLNAIIAFAVLLWLLFLALFILTVLALCGVLVVEWVGYQSMRHSPAVDASAEQERASSPAHDVPMNITPGAPSAFSTRDVEALHDQPPSHSISSPSPVISAELSG